MSTTEAERYTFGYCEDGTVCNTKGRVGFAVKARWRWREKAYCTACLKRARATVSA